ncbi:MAG: holdfast anchor protein HfaD, partial [Asticcacaulis sp.]
MLKRAQIRIVGKMSLATSIAALTLIALPATSQTANDGDFNNSQDQAGDVLATQTLTVIQNDGLTKAESAATGNDVQVGNDSMDANLNSVQTLRGSVRATAYIEGVNTGDEDLSLGTPVYATTQAIGNYATGVTNGAHLTAATHQDSTAAQVETITDVQAPNNAIYVSGEGNAVTEVNHTAYEVTNGRLDAQSWQTSATAAKANVSATVHYSPSPNAYNASATNNSYAAYSDDRGSQEHTVTQDQSAMTQARAEVFAGNVWNMTATSNAVANTVDLQNQGGSLVVDNKQTQTGAVQSQAVVQADQYGEAYATANGIGNQMSAGNNDKYVRIDNNQVSSGGVDVSASFDGNVGWDGYTSATAVGNQAVGYACAECQADMAANNTQLNNSDVTATSNATVARGRSLVSSARATGNSATFYV